MANKNKNKQNEVMYEFDRKGDFTVYLQVYGNNKKLLATLFDEFTTDTGELTRKDLQEIEEYILNHACIKEEYIHHTVMRIVEYDKDMYYIGG